jgi:D-inositol-3-phosphate glycosyltransferase
VPHINESELGPNARVIHIPAGPEAPLSTEAIYPHLQEFTDNVLNFAANNNIAYDVIHSHYWLSGWVAEQLKAHWGVPIIQMFHTLGQMKNRIATSPDQIVGELRIRTETEVMENADYLVAATPAERIQLMWLYRADMHKIHVIPPGVDVQHFTPLDRAEARAAIDLPIRDDEHLLLFVGRIEPLKGIDTLLKALAILKRELPTGLDNLCLSIIGGDPEEMGDEMQRLQQMSRELGLEDFVFFLGSKSQETLQYYYAAAEAVIMPSHYESFGLVALEAMASGRPVIASEVGGLAYLVQDGVTGFHVPDRDPEELAGKIRLLIENEDLREQMCDASVRRARKYVWPLIADQITELYHDALISLPEAYVDHR